ncbi:DUF7144 family membrane protein [Streptomyces massasporeus]
MASHASGAHSGTAARSSERTGAGSGWLVFAAVLMVFGGPTMIFEGIAAIAEDDVFVTTRNYAYSFDLTSWGWIHLIVGVVITLAGAALFQGATWARVVGEGVAGLAMFANDPTGAEFDLDGGVTAGPPSAPTPGHRWAAAPGRRPVRLSPTREQPGWTEPGGGPRLPRSVTGCDRRHVHRARKTGSGKLPSKNAKLLGPVPPVHWRARGGVGRYGKNVEVTGADGASVAQPDLVELPSGTHCVAGPDVEGLGRQSRDAFLGRHRVRRLGQADCRRRSGGERLATRRLVSRRRLRGERSEALRPHRTSRAAEQVTWPVQRGQRAGRSAS